MIKVKYPLIASTIIATSMLSACGGSSSKTEANNGNGVTEAVNTYKSIECKDMLSASQLTLLTTGSSCGYLSVPEKHAIYGQPASEKKIEIAVIKLASISSDKKADPIVYLQGGPGGNASASIGQVIESNTFIKDRDVYLVDQRGTGYSKPALFCTEYNGEAGTPAQIQACKARLEKSGVDLNAYHSVHNALDFIQLREALQIPEWNVYGISYGTRLATTIMRENSEGIRSVILDGMFPIEVNGMSDTPWATYESLNQIVKNCANTDTCPADDFKDAIEDIIARMHNEGMVAESRVFIQNLLELATEPVIINYLMAVNEDISKYSSAFERLITEQDNEQADNEEAANDETFGAEDMLYNAMGLSTVCAEEYPFLNITALTGANSQGWSASTQLAVNGMFHMGFDKASCQVWNVTPANDIETKAITSNLPVLILNGQNDTQTPAAWGALVAKNMPNAQNMTNPQGGHGQLFAGFSCFDTLADEFLAKPNQAVDASCVSAIPEVSYEGGDEEESANFSFKNNDTSSDTVYMNGVIGSDTLDVMQTLLNKYPQIKTIVMQNVPGSMDDDTNLLASMEIRNRGIATHIPADGMVASGGTDMFLAGVKRTIEPGAKLGVHSWGDDSGKEALDYPRDNQAHTLYLDYYKAIGINTEFYWYTLEAATAKNIHWMTAQEIALYGVLTE
ncbi:alpha/beta fold hydrolase [Shewanella psychropiezotolerans]|uniref:Proline iminopeptidase n=1 Tax=Shewanella psychropiezotolerans TaxID=2593655 RepID=A0ABX5X4G0_9GAMM|nr:alpha/beta fold hydrolase [Shewanella psychropiezotolerans]QDO85622.1 alpha/beta fold hydrolase [Shewanella psychropiezotolerans]